MRHAGRRPGSSLSEPPLFRDDLGAGGGVSSERKGMMKTEMTKDWCLAMDRLEAGAEIGAGVIAIDPVFNADFQEEEAVEDSRLALARFVGLMRRLRLLSIVTFAE